MAFSLTSAQAGVFAQSFLDGYCSAGFGAMPKKEIDLLVLRLMIQHGIIEDGVDAQRISRQIQLPVSKVKNLLYELQLRDKCKDEAWLKTQISNSLKHSKLVVTEKDSETRILVGIDNQLLRMEIEAILKRDGHFPDYSFNREILRLTTEAYVTLIEFLLTDAEKRHLKGELKESLKQTKNTQDEESLWKQALVAFVHSTAKAAGKGIVDISVDVLKAGFKLVMDQVLRY